MGEQRHSRFRRALRAALVRLVLAATVAAPQAMAFVPIEPLSHPAVSSFFGGAVAISGDTAVVGAQNFRVANRGFRGAAHVFERRNGRWFETATLAPSGDPAGPEFGTSVAISGDTIIVGAPAETVEGTYGSGAAYIFRRGPSGWTQEARLTAPNLATQQSKAVRFGRGVAISGDFALVGAPFYDGGASDTGVVFDFRRSPGGGWGAFSLALLLPSGIAANDQLGHWIAMDGTRAVFGAQFANANVSDEGAAWVYEIMPFVGGVVWTERTKLLASDRIPGDQFGRNVALLGNTVLVGAFTAKVGTNLQQGAAYVFVGSGSSWTQQAKLVAADGTANALFGSSVALSVDVALVGAPVPDGGVTYAFSRRNSTWTGLGRLPVGPLDANGGFGFAMSVSRDIAMIGAPFQDAGGQLDAGTVLVLGNAAFGAGLLSEQGHIDTSGGDRLGASVAMSDRYVVAGAPDTAAGGAVFVYDRGSGAIGKRGQLLAKLTAADLAIGDKFGGSVEISDDGSTIIAGRPGDDFGLGSIEIFSQPLGGWDDLAAGTGLIVKPAANACGNVAGFGGSIALDGDGTIVVGAPRTVVGAQADVGAVFVLKPVSGTYTPVCVASPRPDDAAQFGSDVAIDGGQIAIGAPLADTGGNQDAGAAFRLMAAVAGTVAPEALPNPSAQIGDKFGTAVAIDDGIVIAGIPGLDTVNGADTGGGAVFASTPGAAPLRIATVAPLNSAVGAGGGSDVAIMGDTILVGADLATVHGKPRQGAAYLFTRPGSIWANLTQEAGYLAAPDGSDEDRFGAAVALSAEGAVAGSPGRDRIRSATGAVLDTGHALVFDDSDLDPDRIFRSGFE